MGYSPPMPRKNAKTAPKPARKRAKDVGADGVTWFTRTQAARYLGVDLSTVKRAQVRGSLAGGQVAGVHVFTRPELDRYRAGNQRGAVAATAFVMLEAGRPVSALVIELEIEPSIAADLARHFAELTESIICASPKGSRAAWSRAFGVELSPAMVLRALELCARGSAKLRGQLLG